MMIGLMMFNFMLFPLVASSITMPDVTNPMTDLFPVVGGSATATGISAGTTNGPSDSISPQQQSTQSCVAGGLIGTGLGIAAVVGITIATGGIATIPAAALVFGGGFGGCVLSGSLFPQGGSSLFSQIVSSTGLFGDFMNALAAALSWVGPVLKFFQHMVSYEFALLTNAPEIGIFLFPLQAVMAIMFLFVGAEYVRGSGIGA
jgi:hypothetical protein